MTGDAAMTDNDPQAACEKALQTGRLVRSKPLADKPHNGIADSIGKIRLGREQKKKLGNAIEHFWGHIRAIEDSPQRSLIIGKMEKLQSAIKLMIDFVNEQNAEMAAIRRKIDRRWALAPHETVELSVPLMCLNRAFATEILEVKTSDKGGRGQNAPFDNLLHNIVSVYHQALNGRTVCRADLTNFTTEILAIALSGRKLSDFCSDLQGRTYKLFRRICTNSDVDLTGTKK